MLFVLDTAVFHYSQGMPQGWYAFATSSAGNFHDTTDLYTTKIGQTGPQCQLRFYYYMDGPSVDSLIAYITMNGVMTPLWETTGGKGQLWRPGSVFIGAKKNVVVSLQARRGQQFSGGISVDDLQFIDCKPPFIRTCRSDEFQCSNKYCIDPNLQCNYADDCGDGSDENVS